MFVSRNLGVRDCCIDAFRGLAIIGMILVNHAPPTTNIYGFLTHAPWVGWTIADTIFPAFLFLVGISISYAFKNVGHTEGIIPHSKIVRRSASLILISILLVNFPYYDLATLKIHGTLTRIGYSYFFASMFAWYMGWKGQLGIVIGILFTQWWFLTQFNVPGFGSGIFTLEANASGYLDKLLLGGIAERFVLNGPVIQGLLPSAAAIASTLIGVLAGRWLQSQSDFDKKVNGLFAIGLVLFFGGSAWGVVLPISKPLWTASYVVLMAGISLQILALIYWLMERREFSCIGKLLQIAGVNALFFYVFAQSVQRILVYGRVGNPDGSSTRLRYLIYENWVEPWVPGKFGALLYALCFLSLCYLVVYALYRRKIFIKL